MTDYFATLSGECSPWPSKTELARYLREAGLDVMEGEYSVHVKGNSHFVFQSCCGECGDIPMIDADADSPEILLREAKLVSSALATAGVMHRFEIYDSNDYFLAYIHHDWPIEA